MTLSELFTPWRTIKRLREDNERLIETIIETLRHLKKGEWSWGFERWPDKPALFVGRTWHDGWHYVLHAGPLWVECDY